MGHGRHLNNKEPPKDLSDLPGPKEPALVKTTKCMVEERLPKLIR